MHVGLPKEIKVKENRVALTPGGVATLVRRGHRVTVERGAGAGSGLPDQEYEQAGATLGSAADAWGAEMVVKVKEPIESEYGYLRDDLLLFTYLHLAADRPLTDALMQAGTTAVAYETVQLPDGSLPLLTPMSEVAGRLSVQAGAYHLQKPAGGKGVLLGGVPGVTPGHVTIVGGGVVGTNAAKMAMGLGAKVTILDVSHRRLTYLDDVFFGRLTTMMSSEANLRALLPQTDLLIGAVLIPGLRLRTSSPATCWGCWNRARSSPTSPLTRAAAWKRCTPPPTTSRPTWWTTSFTTASPTCPARCRAPRLSR